MEELRLRLERLRRAPQQQSEGEEELPPLLPEAPTTDPNLNALLTHYESLAPLFANSVQVSFPPHDPSTSNSTVGERTEDETDALIRRMKDELSLEPTVEEDVLVGFQKRLEGLKESSLPPSSTITTGEEDLISNREMGPPPGEFKELARKNKGGDDSDEETESESSSSSESSGSDSD